MWIQESSVSARVFPHYLDGLFEVEPPPAVAGSGGAAGQCGGRAAVRMTCIDRAIITIHFRNRRSGETKERAALRQVHRQLHGQWMPGWQLPSKLRVERLSAALERKLSVLDSGYARVMVNGEILLIDANTRKVYDVMRAVDGAPRANREFNDGPRRPDPRFRKCGQ